MLKIPQIAEDIHDVAPVHYYGAANDVGYLLSKTGKTVLTSIPLHLQFTRKRKDRHPQHFAQVVRLVKWWINQRKADDADFRFRSFMAEMILSHLSDRGYDFNPYPDALEKFFSFLVQEKLSKRIAFTDYYTAEKLPAKTGRPIEIFDPVNSLNNVAEDYDDSVRRKICAAAEDSLDAIVEARFATTKGRAVDCWRRVFGPSFGG